MTGLLILSLCACSNSKKEDKKDDALYVEVGGEKFKFASDASLKDINYKENYVDFHSDRMGNSWMMMYSKGEKLIFQVRISCLENASLSDVKEKLAYEYSSRKTGGLTYDYAEYKTEDQEKGSEYDTHLYLQEYDGDVYAIVFICAEDISSFEKTFMENVSFSKNS